MLQEFLYTYVPRIYNLLFDLFHLGKRAALAAYTEVTVPKEWIFLKGLDIPIPAQLFPTGADEDQIRWRCTTDPIQFSKGVGELKHLEYLSFSVATSSGRFDLTDWINDVKWIASEGIEEPTPCDIFVLWCCTTGQPYFTNLSTATVTFMDDLGEETTEELKTQNHHTSNDIPHLHHDTGTGAAEADGFDSNRLMDAVLSSSGC